MHEADAARILGAEAFAGQRVAAHLADADGVAKLRDDDRRRQAPPHFGDREQRASLAEQTHQLAERGAAEPPQRDRVHLHQEGGPEPCQRADRSPQHGHLGPLRIHHDEVDPCESPALDIVVHAHGLDRLALARVPGPRRDEGARRRRGGEDERDRPALVVDRAPLRNDIGGPVGHEVLLQVVEVLGGRFEGEDLAPRRQPAHDQSEDADVGPDVEHDGVVADQPPERPHDMGFVAASGVLDLTHDAGVRRRSGQRQRLGVTRNREADLGGFFFHLNSR